MLPLNSFVAENENRMSQFFTSISSFPLSPSSLLQTPAPPNERESAICEMGSFLSQNLKTMVDQLKPERFDLKPFCDDLSKVVARCQSLYARKAPTASFHPTQKKRGFFFKKNEKQLDSSIVYNYFQRCEIGDIQSVEKLLNERKQLIHARGKDEVTGLHVACTFGHVSLLKLLLKRGADPLTQDNKGYTPAHCAVLSGNEEIIAEMCKIKMIDFSFDNDDGNSVLHYFARVPYSPQSPEFLKCFIDNGANINSTNTNGESPLHLAVLKQNTALVNLYLQSGGDPSIKNDNNETPLDWAEKMQNPEIIASLKNFGEESGSTVNEEFVNVLRKTDVSTRIRSFFQVVKEGNCEMVKAFLKVDRKLCEATLGPSRNSALHIAALHGNAETLKILLRVIPKMPRNAIGWTPLMCALWSGNEAAALACLLSHTQGDTQAKIADGTNCFHLAAICPTKQSSLVLFALNEAGVDINGQLSFHPCNTPLHLAVKEGKVETIRLLVQLGANKSKVNKDHLSPVDIAMKMGSQAIIQGLSDTVVSDSGSNNKKKESKKKNEGTTLPVSTQTTGASAQNQKPPPPFVQKAILSSPSSPPSSLSSSPPSSPSASPHSLHQQQTRQPFQPVSPQTRTQSSFSPVAPQQNQALPPTAFVPGKFQSPPLQSQPQPQHYQQQAQAQPLHQMPQQVPHQHQAPPPLPPPPQQPGPTSVPFQPPPQPLQTQFAGNAGFRPQTTNHNLSFATIRPGNTMPLSRPLPAGQLKVFSRNPVGVQPSQVIQQSTLRTSSDGLPLPLTRGPARSASKDGLGQYDENY
jgi:ankyrin repeat protein